MRKDPIQKKAARSAEKRKIRREKERREQKRRMLLGLEPKGDSNRRVAAILNQIGQKKVVQTASLPHQPGEKYSSGFFNFAKSYFLKNRIIFVQ